MRLPDSWKGPYWESRDIWIGVYHNREWVRVARYEAYVCLSVYICLIPCFPIRLRWIDSITLGEVAP